MSNLQYPLTIAVDYDETFTAKEWLFKRFIADAIAIGCKVAFVTWRGEHENNEDILDDAKQLGIDVVFCNGEPKHSMFMANIWVDDCPHSILNKRAGK